MTAPDRKYRCGTCNAEFNSQDELDRHMKNAHKGSTTDPNSPSRKETPAQPNR